MAANVPEDVAVVDPLASVGVAERGHRPRAEKALQMTVALSAALTYAIELGCNAPLESRRSATVKRHSRNT
ncbi:hypothetical protein, partial [Bacillus cereus group sp. Bc237]|uniref:hypothetical protein n=1 Tax=Bacillus cereus group sp. Bc237 TaxID=3018108 RepID=UPI003F24ED0C